jgi:hypothetical protein
MSLPRRLIHNEYDLQDIAEEQDRPIELIERDFALVTIAAHLVDQFPDQLCFKSGFVLRHGPHTQPTPHVTGADQVACQVLSPTTPSTSSPFSFWNCRQMRSDSGP